MNSSDPSAREQFEAAKAAAVTSSPRGSAPIAPVLDAAAAAGAGTPDARNEADSSPAAAPGGSSGDGVDPRFLIGNDPAVRERVNAARAAEVARLVKAGALCREYRIVLPTTVPEYQVGQLYTVAQSSKDATGGGEGIEMLKNEPYEKEDESGQYTHKLYHIESKLPPWLRKVLPKGASTLEETAWNAFPYCETISSNKYLEKDYKIMVLTWHAPGRGETSNMHGVSPDVLKNCDVVTIDIAAEVPAKMYDPATDPTKYSSAKTGRGPLNPGWIASAEPVMTCYKLVVVYFKWWGLQTLMQRMIQNVHRDVFTKFHRQFFCLLDEWHGMTMPQIREMEERLARELQEQMRKGSLKTYVAAEDPKAK